jgi:hypothetical protein
MVKMMMTAMATKDHPAMKTLTTRKLSNIKPKDWRSLYQ